MFMFCLSAPIAVIGDVDNGGMVDESVDGSDSHNGIGKDLVPLFKGLIGRDNQTAVFIPVSNEFKQDTCFSMIFFDVANIIKDQDVKAVKCTDPQKSGHFLRKN